MKQTLDYEPTKSEFKSLPADFPLPEKVFRDAGIGSRTTFYRWEKAGLPVLRVGQRRFIRPRDLSRFMERGGR